MIRKEEESKKQNSKKVILTFDYELALGSDSGTAKKCILEPTEIILSLFKKYNAAGIFFIDAAYLLTLKKNKHKDFQGVANQITEIVKSGNDIGLHLHPQWLDAYPINNDRWGFKSHKKYRLHYLSDNELDKMFKESIHLLEKIAGNSGKKYKINAFRAGGWSIQPFRMIKKYFVKNHILFDFSVNPGLSSQEKSISYFDFTKAPKDLSFWKFEDDPCLPKNDGSFIEIPVTTLKVEKLDLWINYYFYRKKEKSYNDGKTIYSEKNTDIAKKINKLISDLFSNVYATISPDGLTDKYFIKFIEKFEKYDKRDLLALVCHPKNLADSSIRNLEFILKNYKTLSLKEVEKEF